MVVIGIDPGLSGAMAAICERRGLLDVEDLPTCPNGLATGKMLRWLDVEKISETLKDWSARYELAKEDVMAFLERPIAMPSQQISTAASNFDSMGALRTVVLLKGYRMRMVTPNEWKRFYKIGTDKEEGRQVAANLYPGAPITRKKDHNRAEAILIARYGMRSIAG